MHDAQRGRGQRRQGRHGREDLVREGGRGGVEPVAPVRCHGARQVREVTRGLVHRRPHVPELMLKIIERAMEGREQASRLAGLRGIRHRVEHPSRHAREYAPRARGIRDEQRAVPGAHEARRRQAMRRQVCRHGLDVLVDRRREHRVDLLEDEPLAAACTRQEGPVDQAGAQRLHRVGVEVPGRGDARVYEGIGVHAAHRPCRAAAPQAPQSVAAQHGLS